MLELNDFDITTEFRKAVSTAKKWWSASAPQFTFVLGADFTAYDCIKCFDVKGKICLYD